MENTFIIEKAIPHVRKGTILAKRPGDINRISVCYNGTKGYINRSGAILCREIEAKKIMCQKEEVTKFMKRLFGKDFKSLYIASSNNLDNPARGDKRHAYFKH